MARKEVVRPLGAKPNQLGMKRKNAPGRYTETTKKLEAAAGRSDGRDAKRCAFDNRIETVNGNERIQRCEAYPTNFVRWAWWCAQHTPAPDPDCPHEQWSPLWGRKVCSLCTIDLGPLPERVRT